MWSTLSKVLVAIVLASAAPGPVRESPSIEHNLRPVLTTLRPVVIVRGGTTAEHLRLEVALARFTAAGLVLPDLEVEFGENRCDGRLGLFDPSHPRWQIRICSSLDFLYEHELAHAWELANLSDETRAEFMRMRGYSTWAGEGVPWIDRGIEGVAFIIQQGLSGRAPQTPSPEHESRLAAFELLTGRRPTGTGTGRV